MESACTGQERMENIRRALRPAVDIRWAAAAAADDDFLNCMARVARCIVKFYLYDLCVHDLL